MAIRCYIPTTLSALSATLDTATAVAPDAAAAGLRGDELDEVEYTAMMIAAGLAAEGSFASAGSGQAPSPRVVVAYDAPADSPRTPLAAGFDLLTLTAVDPAHVVSVHLDEAPVWAAAVNLGEVDAGLDRLGESDLLWYDRTELEALLADRT